MKQLNFIDTMPGNDISIEKEISNLRSKIEYHNNKYYNEDALRYQIMSMISLLKD